MIRRLAAECLGTALLLAIVVGSGIMAEQLAGGNGAVALLANTIATGAGLFVLILTFGPVSAAHFNPAVTLAVRISGGMTSAAASAYVVAQIAGAVIGVWTAHLMFAEPVLQLSAKARDGFGQALSEAVATFGLIGAIEVTRRRRPDVTPSAVALWIVAAYWFTASTSFANPAVTIARTLTDTFAGIAPQSAPLFIAGQIAGTIAGLAAFGWLLQEETR